MDSTPFTIREEEGSTSLAAAFREGTTNDLGSKGRERGGGGRA